MAMKKAIVRVEIKYDDKTTDLDQVVGQLEGILKRECRHQRKVKNGVFERRIAKGQYQENIDSENWSAECVYYPY